MAKNFKELQAKLYAKMTPEQLAERDASIAKELAKIRLRRAREAQKITQATPAAKA